MGAKNLTAEDILLLSRSYQAACVLAAAVDLGVFTLLADAPLGAAEAARGLACDPRGTTTLLDALAALGLLEKRDDRYAPAPGVAPLLSEGCEGSVLPMVWHQANCLRRWVQLPVVVKTGRPAERAPSPRGAAADLEAFIGGMNVLAAPVAAQLVAAVVPPGFTHVLDIGGASGTWTIAFLRAAPAARATLFDLPEVMPLARRRLEAEGLIDRVTLAAGDFMRDPLPQGADLAWVSAIVHQNSRAENRRMLSSIGAALAPGGRVAIRDIVMDASRVAPVAGALFAVNMLVGTEGGGTFTFDELRQDLEAAGFTDVALRRRDEGMHSIVVARRGSG
jgi:SAM-dependent methyltransferase